MAFHWVWKVLCFGCLPSETISVYRMSKRGMQNLLHHYSKAFRIDLDNRSANIFSYQRSIHYFKNKVCLFFYYYKLSTFPLAPFSHSLHKRNLFYTRSFRFWSTRFFGFCNEHSLFTADSILNQTIAKLEYSECWTFIILKL